MKNQSTNSLPANFETFEQACDRRRALVRDLNRGGKPAQELARISSKCRIGSRCQSGACPVCERRHRKWLVKSALPIIDQYPEWTCVSVVPEKLLVPLGQLAELNLNKIVETNRRRLQRSAVSDLPVIGGVDISHNTEENRDIGWQAHLYFLIAAPKTEHLDRAIRNAIPLEPTALRPYQSDAVYYAPGAITYAYKAVFDRRSIYYVDGKRRKRDLPLKPPEQRELALFLDQYRIGDRLILRGMRRDGGRLRLLPCRRDSNNGV